MRRRAGELLAGVRLRVQLAAVVWRAAPQRAAALVGLVLARAGVPIVEAIAHGLAVGSVPAAARDGFDSPAGDRLVLGIALSAGAFLVGQVCYPVIEGLGRSAGRRVDRLIQQRAIAAALLPPGIDHLEDRWFADQLAVVRGSRGGDFTPGGGVPALAAQAASTLGAVGSGVILARFNLWLGLSVIVANRFMRWTFIADFLRQAKALTGRAESMRRSSYLRDLALTPPAAKELRVFGLSRWLLERFSAAWNEGMGDVWTTRKGGRRDLTLTILGLGVLHVAGLLVIGRAGVRGELSLREASTLASALFLSMNLSLGDSDLHLAYGLTAIPALEAAEREARRRAHAAGAGTEPATGMPATSIRFESVSFAYPGSETQVVDGLDLEIEAGRSLAIVGENGAGKTTLIKLLTAMYRPTAGRITVDGVDLADLDPASWRAQLGVIFQDFVRYELSARENVTFGAPASAAHDQDAVERAAERAGALDVVLDLADGWDTVLSRRFEEGTDLSGGQWQRVALARAMYAVEQGARMLILDEPTANLDAKAEADLYERFIEMTAGLTTIVISHRFSTVRRADRIAVVDDGRIVELGGHDELVALDGRYARMFRLQAARFDEPAGSAP